MRFAPLPSVRLAYDVTGERGTPVLLIMGFALPGSAWRHQIPALAAAHRVAWFDNRGCGLSRARSGLYSMSDLASDAVGLLDHLGWGRAHVVGVSMGGMVAQRLALLARHRVRSLSLIATHAGGLRAKLPSVRGALGFLRANVGPRERRQRALVELLFPPSYLGRVGAEVVEQGLLPDLAHLPPLRFRLSQLAAVGRHDTRRRLRRLSDVPTLVVVPGRDVLVRPQAVRSLAGRIPGAQVEIFTEAGHGILSQESNRLNERLLEHFRQADEARHPRRGA